MSVSYLYTFSGREGQSTQSEGAAKMKNPQVATKRDFGYSGWEERVVLDN